MTVRDMTVGQKASLSLLIAVVFFAVLSVAAFSGLFNVIESDFFSPSISRGLESSLDAIATRAKNYHELNLAKFRALLGLDAMKRSFLPNSSAEDAQSRAFAFGQLQEELVGLSGLRLVDSGGKRIQFSTIPADVTKRSGLELIYRNYGDPGDLAYDSVASGNGAPPSVKLDAASGRFIYSLPFFDSFGDYRGTALFYVAVDGLTSLLVKEGLSGVGDAALVVADKGILLKAPLVGRDLIAARVAEAWTSALDQKPLAITAGAAGESYVLFTKSAGPGGYVGFVLSSTVFVLPSSMKWLLLGSFFITAYLLVFLLLNLRQDRMTVLSDRIKRFQISLLEEYVDNKSELDFGRWRRELEARRGDVHGAIRRSIGRVRPSRQPEVDELIDKSWDEILAILGGRAGPGSGGVEAPRAEVGSVGIREIERLLGEALKNGSFILPPGSVVQGAVSTAARPGVSAPSPAELEPVAEAELLEEAEAVEEAEELAPLVAAPAPAEAVEEAGLVEEAESVEEAEAAAEAELLEEAEAVEEAEELAPLVAAPAPAEAVEEAGLVEEAESVEEAEAAAEAELLEEAEAVEELEPLEAAPAPAEAVEEAGLLEEAESVEEAEAVEELEPLEAAPAPAEAVEEAGLVEEAESVEEAEAVEELEPLEAAPAPAEAVEEAGLVEEAESVEEAEAVVEAELLEEAEEAEAVEELEPLEAAPALAEAGEEAGLLEEAESVEEAEAVEELAPLEAERETPSLLIMEEDESHFLEELPAWLRADVPTSVRFESPRTGAAPRAVSLSAPEEMAELEVVEELEAAEELGAEEPGPVEELGTVEEFDEHGWLGLPPGGEGGLLSASAHSYELASGFDDDIPVIPESSGLELAEEADIADIIGFIDVDDTSRVEDLDALEGELGLEGEAPMRYGLGRPHEPEFILDAAEAEEEDSGLEPIEEVEFQLLLSSIDLSSLEQWETGPAGAAEADATRSLAEAPGAAPSRADADLVFEEESPTEPGPPAAGWHIARSEAQYAAGESDDSVIVDHEIPMLSDEVRELLEFLPAVEPEDRETAELSEFLGPALVYRPPFRLEAVAESATEELPVIGEGEPWVEVEYLGEVSALEAEADESLAPPSSEDGPILYKDGLFQLNTDYSSAGLKLDNELRNLVNSVLEGGEGSQTLP